MVRAGLPPTSTVLGHLGFFLFGMLLADIFADEWRGALPAPQWRWDLLVVPGWLALPLFWEYPLAPRAALPAILFGLAYGSLRSAGCRAFLGWTPVVVTGGMCYTIYLLHWHLLRWLTLLIGDQLVIQASFPLTMLTYLAVVALPVGICCVTFFLLIEKPCMRKDWPRRLLQWFRRTPRMASGFPLDRPASDPVVPESNQPSFDQTTS